jgi:hypothetical protein
MCFSLPLIFHGPYFLPIPTISSFIASWFITLKLPFPRAGMQSPRKEVQVDEHVLIRILNALSMCTTCETLIRLSALYPKYIEYS